MKGFSLGKRRKSELADGALVARIVGVLPVRGLANSSLTFSVMMDSLHHKEGHERHEQQPCYYDSAFCLYSLNISIALICPNLIEIAKLPNYLQDKST